MVGVFFLCNKLSMDIVKLCDKLFDDKDLQDIPMEYIFRVAYAVLVIMAEGECFYRVDFE